MAELWVALVNSLQRRGISRGSTSMTGQSREQVLARLQAEADRSLKRELLLDAVADKLAVQVSDEEIGQARPRAGRRDGRGARRDRGAPAPERESGEDSGFTFAYRRSTKWSPVSSGSRSTSRKLRGETLDSLKEKGGSGMKIWT